MAEQASPERDVPIINAWLMRLRPGPELDPGQQRSAWRWQNAAIEALSVCLFMIFLAAWGTALEHPSSVLQDLLPTPFSRRAAMGTGAGTFLALLGASPLGQRSGAHINPAVTLAMAAIGRINVRTAGLYAVAQMLGAILGMAAAGALLGGTLAHPEVGHIVTEPGVAGALGAFLSEALLSFVLMAIILGVSSRPRWAAQTGRIVGVTIALFITFAAPLSGMSLNPARTLSAAWSAEAWRSVWIYLLAPPMGMLAAAALFVYRRRHRRVRPLPGD